MIRTGLDRIPDWDDEPTVVFPLAPAWSRGHAHAPPQRDEESEPEAAE